MAGNYLGKLHEYDLADQMTGGWIVVDEPVAAPGGSDRRSES